MAYLLDTNIISELRKRRAGRADPRVTAWADSVEEREMFLSVLVMGELRGGIESGRKRDPRKAIALDHWFANLETRFRERMLPVTAEVAARWGRLCPDQRLPAIDGLQAATALKHDYVFVTRNTADVVRSGVRLLNPFTWPLPTNGGSQGSCRNL